MSEKYIKNELTGSNRASTRPRKRNHDPETNLEDEVSACITRAPHLFHQIYLKSISN